MRSNGTTVAILCHDLSDNSVGRAYILAKALNHYYATRIIGPATKGEIWRPLQGDKSIKYKIINSHLPSKAVKDITEDILFVSKPKGTSFGYGMLAKRHNKKPLILDIDDWDLGFIQDASLAARLHSLIRLWDLNSLGYTWVLEKLIHRANTITVSNTFLQKRFGGELIPHFRDTRQFSPNKFSQAAQKKKLGLANKKIVLFLGTPRKHKGIFDLIRAVDRIKRKDIALLIVGANAKDQKKIPMRPYLKLLGQQAFEDIPGFLAAADVVAIFQSDSKASQGQLPAKLFDAMSMARPIVASRVSDLPKVLKGCGELVEPGNIDELTNRINYLLDNPKYAKELGCKAREKCIKEYSYDAIAPKLHAVVEDVLAKARTTAKT